MKLNPSSPMTEYTQEHELSQATFQRCPHDPENPYLMVSHALIRDINISPECRWLIIYLLSNKQGWKINMAQIVKHVRGHMGRDRAYHVMSEAIESGYIKREKVKRGNLEHTVYYVSESPKFKKCFRHPDFQDTETPDTENQYNKNNIDKKEQEKNIVSEPPPDAGLTIFFFEKLIEINPKIREPNLKLWANEMKRLQSVDGRTEEEVRKVIDFIVEQHKNPKREFTWAKAVMSPEKLRKHFAAIWLEMNTKTDVQKKGDANDEKIKVLESNKAWAKKIKARVDGKLSDSTRFYVSDTSVSLENKRTGTHVVIGYLEKGFKNIVENFLKKSLIEKDNIIKFFKEETK